MFVIKRNGSKEEFSTEKIKSAMLKAFQACHFPLSEKDKKDISVFLDNIEKDVSEDISVEDIQNKVEKYLCKRWFPVGKAYMLYRKKHTEARIISDKVINIMTLMLLLPISLILMTMPIPSIRMLLLLKVNFTKIPLA